MNAATSAGDKPTLSLVPSEAVAFLGAVGAFLFILIVFFLYLNKLLCFKNCGGFPCGDESPKKKGQKSKELGAAYAYEDESSSDSDDEVLRRFTSSAAIKHSASTYSQKVSASEAQISHSASKLSFDTPGMADKSQVKQESGTVQGIIDERSIQTSASPSSGASTTMSQSSSKVGKLIDTDSPVHSSTALPTRHGQTPHSSDTFNVTPSESRSLEATASLAGTSTMASAHMQEGMQTFNNEAFEGTSMSASGHITDEHLFNIQDLQNDVPLISKCGSLEVTFSYNQDRVRMEITIHQAQGIPTKDRGGASNTQVRLLLLPTRKQRHKTKVKQGDNPVFEETFAFKHISKEEATGFGIRFRLYGVERLRHDRMIGECIIGFASLSLEAMSTHWIILEPRSNLSQGDSKSDVTSLSRSDSASSTQSLQHGGMPELLLGLAYNGTTGRLSVEVIKGSNFRNMAMNRAPDTYVRLTLMAPNGKEVTHSKTSVRRGQPNPLFKETFMFQVALFQLADVTLMVSVYNKKSMKKKEMIGWIALGLNSSGEEETSHWSDMRESKGENICRWHALLES